MNVMPSGLFCMACCCSCGRVFDMSAQKWLQQQMFLKTKNLSLSMHLQGVFWCFLMLVSGRVLHANWFICLKPQGKCSLKLQQAKLIWICSFFWYIPVDLQVSKIQLRSFLWLLLDANSEGQGMLQKTLKSTNKWLQLTEVIVDS